MALLWNIGFKIDASLQLHSIASFSMSSTGTSFQSDNFTNSMLILFFVHFWQSIWSLPTRASSFINSSIHSVTVTNSFQLFSVFPRVNLKTFQRYLYSSSVPHMKHVLVYQKSPWKLDTSLTGLPAKSWAIYVMRTTKASLASCCTFFAIPWRAKMSWTATGWEASFCPMSLISSTAFIKAEKRWCQWAITFCHLAFQWSLHQTLQ